VKNGCLSLKRDANDRTIIVNATEG
jgi:hypothetical protein